MKVSSKICDAADWFHPEINAIIREELREIPRFHRKQWEFAMIFHVLRERGLLRPDSLGLSMGGGKELLLYAIASHIRQLVVTDLYDTQTTWDCAKTNDPDEFIRAGKPFPVDDNKVKALRMDMRALEFEENTFDFCYSSCSIEHIGTRDDFLLHLNEASRVLKDGGIYVLTTELGYGEEIIEHPNNYVFTRSYLNDLFEECGLTPETECNGSIVPHKVNYPIPANMKGLCHTNGEALSTSLFQEYTHVQLLRGKHPYTSALFVLRKESKSNVRSRMIFSGIEASRSFLAAGIQEYRSLLDTTRVTLHPFSFLPREVSPFFADHADFFAAMNQKPDRDGTLFHTDYYWFGSGTRTFSMKLASYRADEESLLELRLHRYRTAGPVAVECVKSMHCVVSGEAGKSVFMTVDVNDEYTYALLAKVVSGSCVMKSVEITSWAGTAPSQVSKATGPALIGDANPVRLEVRGVARSLKRLLHL